MQVDTQGFDRLDRGPDRPDYCDGFPRTFSSGVRPGDIEEGVWLVGASHAGRRIQAEVVVKVVEGRS